MPFEVHFIPAGLSIRSGMEEHMVIPARILPLISSFVSAREKINHRHQASLMAFIGVAMAPRHTQKPISASTGQPHRVETLRVSE
jgi:hypothetical protein